MQRLYCEYHQGARYSMLEKKAFAIGLLWSSDFSKRKKKFTKADLEGCGRFWRIVHKHKHFGKT